MSLKLIKSICFAAGIALVGSAFAQAPGKVPAPTEHSMSQEAHMAPAKANAAPKQGMKPAPKNKALKKPAPKKPAPPRAKAPQKPAPHAKPCDAKPTMQDTCSMPK